MKRAIVLLTILLTGCNSDASAPTIEKRINADVPGATYTPRKFYDAETSVTCYYLGYHAISCVKTN